MHFFAVAVGRFSRLLFEGGGKVIGRGEAQNVGYLLYLAFSLGKKIFCRFSFRLQNILLRGYAVFFMEYGDKVGLT